MIDEIVTLETAKLAKEKGYPNDGELPIRAYYPKIRYFAPTQSLLQRWLREVHGINMLLERYPDYYWVYGWIWEESNPLNHNTELDFSVEGDTYEEALEKGLQEGLRLINTKQKE